MPEEWIRHLEDTFALYGTLGADEQARLRDDMRIFHAEKHWEGCGELELEDRITVPIAGQACLLTLGRSVDAYDHVHSILVYPEAYRVPVVSHDESGVVSEWIDDREGESWERGTVILSWTDAVFGAGEADGRNLVIHEFAHQIDLLDALSGPYVPSSQKELYRRWETTFLDAFDAFCGLVDEGREDPVLDPYGAEDEAEFFAVAAEAFFEIPRALRHHHPNLYGLLSEYFNQDPARRRPA